VHLSEEALDFVGAAAASPEVEMEPHLPPETNSRFHQELHSIKLARMFWCRWMAGTTPFSDRRYTPRDR